MINPLSELLEKSTLLEFSLNKLRQGVLWVDQKGKIIWINDSYREWCGLSESEIAHSSIFELSPTLNFLKWKQDWKKLISKKHLEIDTQHLHYTGNLYPVRLQAYLFQQKDHFFACCIVDDKLQSDRHQELLSTVTAALHMGVWEWDDLRKEFWATPDFYQLLALSTPEPITCDNWKSIVSEFLVATDASQLIQLFQKALSEGTAFSTDIQVKASDLNLRVVANTTVTDEKVVKVYGVIQNVQQEHQELLKLRSTQFTLDQANEAIIWSTADAKIIYANGAAAQLLGYSTDELLSMKFTDFSTQFNLKNWSSLWEELQKRKHISSESSHRHKEGYQIPVSVSINYYEFGNQQFNCTFIRDISARKQKDQELLEAYQEISQLKERYELENIYLKEEIRQSHNFGEIITSNQKYQKLLGQIGQVAETDATVLILGETGTGKELLARAIHRLSKRINRPLIKVNCAALPPNLIESELFGHEKGAFTGAIKRKIGRFELADGGTVFLDEIGELPMDVQVKLLRMLQEGEFERVGSSTTLTTDIRIIAATNRDLPKLIEQDKFRQDLFYRLNVFPIYNLPLRERKDDIPLLVEHFMRKFSEKIGKKINRIAKPFMDKLQQYDFPGNIRELENLIERAVILSDTNYLNLEQWVNQPDTVSRTIDGFRTFEQMQHDYILEALQRTNWKVSGEAGAAEILGLNPKTLESKMRKMKIRRQDYLSE